MLLTHAGQTKEYEINTDAWSVLTEMLGPPISAGEGLIAVPLVVDIYKEDPRTVLLQVIWERWDGDLV